LFCVNNVIKAFGTEATIQSLVPHLQLCPQSTDRAVTKSSVSCFADRIIHMARVFVFTGSLYGSLIGEQGLQSIYCANRHLPVAEGYERRWFFVPEGHLT